MTVHCLFITTLGNEVFDQNYHLDTVVLIASVVWKMRRQTPRFPAKLAAFLALSAHLHHHGKASPLQHPKMLLQRSATIGDPDPKVCAAARAWVVMHDSVLHLDFLSPLGSLQCLLDWDCQTSPSCCGSKAAKWFWFSTVTIRIKMSTSLINKTPEVI